MRETLSQRRDSEAHRKGGSLTSGVMGLLTGPHLQNNGVSYTANSVLPPLNGRSEQEASCRFVSTHRHVPYV